MNKITFVLLTVVVTLFTGFLGLIKDTKGMLRGNSSSFFILRIKQS